MIRVVWAEYVSLDGVVEEPAWTGPGDVGEGVSKLKQQDGGDLLIYGSTTLADTLRQHDLIDEYRLMLFPVVVGKGKRLFPDGIDTKTLKLADVKKMSNGVVVLYYEPVR